MRRVILLCFLLPLLAFGQTKIPVSPNLRDVNGLRVGHWTILCDSLFDETLNLDSARYFRQALFEKGKPVGIVRDYYLSGRKQWEGVLLEVSPNVFDGAYTQYHENGQVNIITNYTKNKENGYKKVYYANGTLYYECNMIEDNIQGRYIQYYEHGGKRWEADYVKNKIIGEYISYYPNGAVELKIILVNDTLAGLYQVFFENGFLKIEGVKENGDNTGVWKYYNEDGVQNGIRTYVKGKLYGHAADYFPDKKVDNKGIYKNELRDSVWSFYYPSGKLKRRGSYIGDSATGNWEYYYESGKIHQIAYYKDNKYDSTWTTFSESGTKTHTTQYKENLINGRCKGFLENGKLQYEGVYAKGKLNGYYKEYFGNDKIKIDGNYLDGKIDGQYVVYFENGKLKELGIYIGGENDGLYTTYFENGQIQKQGKYVLGYKDSTHNEYYENGQLKQTKQFTNGIHNGWHKDFYTNGIQQLDLQYKNGLAYGKSVSRYENGNVHVKGNYVLGAKEGLWLWYYQTAELKESNTYKNDKAYGEYMGYYENGKVKYRGSVKNGKKNGIYQSYDSLGVKTSEGIYKNGLMEGEWNDYYPKTGTLKVSYGYLNSKNNGKFIYYKADKTIDKTVYYINGFKENLVNVNDSITKLRAVKDFRGALLATQWLERVIGRDYKNPDEQTDAIYQYAGIYYQMNNYEASSKWWSTYRDKTKLYSGDTVNNYAVALSGIALNLKALGKNEESLKAHDEALLAIEKAVGRFSDNYLIVLTNKIGIYADLQQHSKKEAVLLNELALRREQFKNEPIQICKVYKYLASHYYTVAKYPEAINYYQQLKSELSANFVATANKIDEQQNQEVGALKKWKGSDFYPTQETYPYYNAACKGLADCYNEINEYKKAIAELISYQTQSKNWALATAYHKAENYNLLGKLYKNASINDTSTMYYEATLAYASQNNWAENEIVRDANLGLANLAADATDYTKAIQYYAKVIKYCEQIGDSQTNTYADALRSYAYSLYKSDNKNAAIALEYYIKSTKIKKELYGDNAFTYLYTAMKTAAAYKWNYKYQQADSLLLGLEKPIVENYGKLHWFYNNYLEYLANSLFDQSKFAQAIPVYEQICEYYKPKKEGQESYSTYLAQISTCYSITGEKSKSKAYLLKATEVHKANKGVENEVYFICRSLLASMMEDENLKNEAEKIYKELVVSYAKLSGNPSIQYAKSHRDLGFFYFNSSNYEKALLSFQKSSQILKQLNDNTSDDYIKTQIEIGRCQEYLLQHDLALDAILLALKPSKMRYGNNSYQYADALRRLASIYLNQKLYDKALKSALQAADIARQTFGKESKETADFEKMLANIYSQMDKNKDAEELYLHRVAIYNKVLGKSNFYYLNAINDLFQFYSSFGQYAEAEKIVDEDIAITLAINEKDKIGYANKLYKKGTLLLSWKKYAQADTLYRKILAIREAELAFNDREVIATQNQLGLCAWHLNNIKQAEKAFNFCVDQYKLKKDTQSSNYAISLFNTASVHLQKNEFALAEKKYRKAVSIYAKYCKSGSIEEINLLDNVAALYQAWGKYDLAEKYWLEVTSKLLKYINTNFYFLSDSEKAQFWLKNKDAFESFNTFAILRSKENPQILSAMYNYQLATKAILLSASNKIKKRILSSPDSSLVQNYYKWTNYKEALSKAYILTEEERKTQKINLPLLEMEANKLEKSLNITTEEVASEDQAKTIGWKDIQKTLTVNEAVVEIIRMRYFDKKLTDSIVYAALILTSETKINPLVVVLPNGAQLEKSYLAYYKNAIALKIDDENSFDAYLAPIYEKIKSKNQLYISLDGVYNSINLQSLLLPNGKYLLEEKNISIVTNSKDVLLFKTGKNQNYSSPTAVLLGFPKYFIGKISTASKSKERNIDELDRSGIAELPGTKTEIEKVDEILTNTKWESSSYFGEDANEVTLKAIRNPRILHIATHGFFVEPSQKNEFNGKGMQVFASQQNPLLRSGLLLSGAANYIQNKTTFSDENGILTAYEAANLNLENTDLVVLSACETGKGEISNGEGVYGLQRAFQVAGAKAVIMSLWKVNDTATQELMTSFYQQWMGGMNKQKAFYAAQMQLKEKYKSPYYWAAFVMVGN